MVKVLVLFYSTYGHIYTMAKAAADAVNEIEGAEVSLKRVPETLPQEVLEKMGAVEAQKVFEHVPIATVEEYVYPLHTHIHVVIIKIRISH